MPAQQHPRLHQATACRRRPLEASKNTWAVRAFRSMVYYPVALTTRKPSRVPAANDIDFLPVTDLLAKR
jgi:hypothetical protein